MQLLVLQNLLLVHLVVLLEGLQLGLMQVRVDVGLELRSVDVQPAGPGRAAGGRQRTCRSSGRLGCASQAATLQALPQRPNGTRSGDRLHQIQWCPGCLCCRKLIPPMLFNKLSAAGSC
jgi:hypothetical protein